MPYPTILYCTVPPLKPAVNFQSMLVTAKALWWLSGTSICLSNARDSSKASAPVHTLPLTPRGVKVHTYSLKRRLWILVMAFEAMGLPMPELAGEPWDTGVML